MTIGKGSHGPSDEERVIIIIQSVFQQIATVYSDSDAVLRNSMEISKRFLFHQVLTQFSS